MFTRLRTLLCIVITILALSAVHAQDVVTATVTYNGASEEGQAVKIGNDVHALEGVTYNVTVTINESLPDLEIVEVLATTDSRDYTIGTPVVAGNSATFGITTTTESAVQPSFEVHFTYNEIIMDEEGNEISRENKQESAKATMEETLHTYAKPEISNVPSQEIEYILSLGEDKKYSAPTVSGGNGGWQIRWNGTETEDNSYTISLADASKGSITETKLTVVNLAPDGKTEWFPATEYKLKLYVYNYPLVTLSSKPQNRGKENTYYKKVEGNWTFNETPGSGNWKYIWSYGGQDHTEHGKSTNPYSFEVSDKLEDTLKVTAICYANDGEENPKELYRRLFEYPVTIYPKASFNLESESSDVYEGANVIFTANCTGAYSEGWGEYVWYVDNIPQEETSNKLTLTNLKAEELKSKSYTVSFSATNKCNDDTWDTAGDAKQLTVYPVPQAAFTSSIKKKNVTGEFVTPQFSGKTDSLTFTTDGESVCDYTIRLIEGDKVNLSAKAVSDCNNGNSSANWKIDQEIPYVASLEGEQDSTIVTKELVVSHKIPENETREFKYIYRIKVYAKPELTGNYDRIVTYKGSGKDGRALIGGIKGGYDKGWSKTEYYINERQVDPDTLSADKDYTLKCKYHYEYDGVVRLNETSVRTFEVWPAPIIKLDTLRLQGLACGSPNQLLTVNEETRETTIECYVGNTLQFTFSHEGGYTGADDSWTCSIDGSSMPEMKDKSDSIQYSHFHQFENPSESTPQILNLRIRNEYTGPKDARTDYSSINREYPYTIKVNAWRKPNYNVVSKDSIGNVLVDSNPFPLAVYAGGYEDNKMHFDVRQVNGYQHGGWKEEWRVVSGRVDSESSVSGVPVEQAGEEYIYTPTCASNSYEDKTVVLYLENKIGENVGFRKYFYYPIRVYPKVGFSDDFWITDVNQNRSVVEGTYVREGNGLEVSVSPLLRGSRDYVYSWYGFTTETNSNIQNVTVRRLNSEVKKSVTETYTLQYYDEGIYQHSWDSRKYWDGKEIVKHFTIYAKPATPTGLMKKGSGASGTMIATTDGISDQDLINRDYYLVFGYVNANGTDVRKEPIHQDGIGQTRWSSQFTQAEVNNPSNKFYVFALWKYDNGVKITSGKRFVNGVDEQWDGSWDDTRAGGDDTTSILQIEDDTIPVTESETNAVGIYSVSGKPLTQYAKGLNIVRMKDGTVRKVYVK